MRQTSVEVSQKIKFGDERTRYTVQAFSQRYIIATKVFKLKRNNYLYTIIDVFRGIRGPSDLLFGSPYTFNDYEGATMNIAMLHSGRQSISLRKAVPLTVEELEQISKLIK
jgi:hypothetical protein